MSNSSQILLKRLLTILSSFITFTLHETIIRSPKSYANECVEYSDAQGKTKCLDMDLCTSFTEWDEDHEDTYMAGTRFRSCFANVQEESGVIYFDEFGVSSRFKAESMPEPPYFKKVWSKWYVSSQHGSEIDCVNQTNSQEFTNEWFESYKSVGNLTPKRICELAYGQDFMDSLTNTSDSTMNATPYTPAPTKTLPSYPKPNLRETLSDTPFQW